MKHKIAIIGSGPAGFSAGIYTARAELETTIYAGSEPGGQLTKTAEVENYPGVVGKTGPELVIQMQRQAEKMGARVVYKQVKEIRKTAGGKQLELDLEKEGKREYGGVILAMGAKSRLLGIGEEKYYGKGFSTCAVCDAPFYRNKDVYVVGGGDAAVEEAWILTKFAKSVTMLVRRGELSASKALQKRVLDNPGKIKVLWKTNLQKIKGERVEELVLEAEGKERVVKAGGVFMAIGHEPATKWLRNGEVKLDEKGYIKIGFGSLIRLRTLVEYPMMTSIEGVFAAGDCVDDRYRQAVTAAGMGVMAALDLEKWLENSQ